MRRSTITLLLALALGACGGSNSTDSPPAQDVPFESRTLEAEVDLEVAGAIEAQWSGSTVVQVLTNTSELIEERNWQLTVAVMPQRVIELDSGINVRPGFDLVGYRGDGDYTITPERVGGLSEEELSQLEERPELLESQGTQVHSRAFVLAGPSATELTSYSKVVEACALAVDEGGLEGSLSCPSLAAGTDSISLTFTWRADPEREVMLDDPAQPEGDATTTTSASSSTTASPVTPSTGAATGGRYVLEADFKLDIAIDPPDCATRGQLAVVRVATIPDAAITLVLAYKDGGSYGNAISGQTEPEGRFNWAFVVTPTAPLGQVDLLVSVASNDQERAGGGIVKAFVVREKCS